MMELEEQVRSKVWKQLWDRADGHMLQVSDQVINQVNDQVWSQVRNQARSQAWSQIILVYLLEVREDL